MEKYVDRDMVILKKYEPSCIFCGNAKDIKHFEGKNICSGCITRLSE
ncbi:hypothetical protein [Tepidibacter aestuarii]|nr:protein of unknown function [Tepidibacter aestuarii]